MKHEINLYLGNQSRVYDAYFCGTKRIGDIMILGISDASRRLRYVSEMDDSVISTFDEATVKETDIVYL